MSNREYFNLKPINNTSSGFGHSVGLSQIKFSLSNQNKVVEELQLIGEVVVYWNDGTLNDDANDKDIYTPKKAGLNALFKTMTVSSKATGTVIERVNNVHRLVASLNTMTNSQSDMECDIMGWALNDDTVMKRLSYGYDSRGQPFKLNLPLGMFNSGRKVLDLSNAGFKGLDLTLNMNTDAVIFSGTDADDKKPYVVLKNVSLVGSWMDIEPNKKPEIIPFKTYSSFFNVLNSSNETVSTTLGLSNVVSFFANFQATSDSSDYDAECDQLGQLNNLNKVSFSKGGVLRPNNYRIEPSPLLNDSGTTNQILRQYNSSVVPYNDLKRSNVNLESLESVDGTNSGIGCRFTTTSGKGDSFKLSNFSVNLQSDLGKTEAEPTGMYSFFINNNVVGVKSGMVEVFN